MDKAILKDTENCIIEELKARNLTYSDAEKVLNDVISKLGEMAKL